LQDVAAVTSPLHSLAAKKANKRRKVVLTPVHNSYTESRMHLWHNKRFLMELIPHPTTRV